MKRHIIVIGAGSIGRRHARLLAERADVAVGLCEPDAAALERARVETPSAKTYRTLEEALAARPAAVVVATPHHLHAEQTVAALESGAHVLCEKPISDRLEDALRMREAAQRAGRVLSIGFHLHFHPGAQRMKELIAGGALGTVLHAHCRVGSYITLVNSLSRYQATLEGALLLDYAHQPDLLVWLLGKRPRGVRMDGITVGDLEFSSRPNVLSLTLDYDAPLLATVHLNYVQMPERHEYEIAGDRGWLLWDLSAGRIRIANRAQQNVVDEPVSTERDPVYRTEHQAFLDAVDGRRRPESPAEEASVSLAVIQAALASWKEGRRVEVDAV